MSFQSKCRIGNWQEDEFAKEEAIKAFLQKQEEGKLLHQKVEGNIMASSARVKLSVAENNTIRFGDVVMLHHPFSDSYIGVLPPPLPTVKDNIPVVSAPNAATPASRTAFHILHQSGEEVDGDVGYEDKFFLYANIPGKGRLFLCSEKLGLHAAPARKSKQQNVYAIMVNEDDSLPTKDCLWEFMELDKDERFVTQGEPVRISDPVVINHVKTGQHLAALQQFVWKTEYGAQFEVTAHTHLDGRRLEKEENFFKIIVD
eukprot:m.137620 g.137620  ORF g.137620 m.137620 type:complete len:258 (+) comp12043_c0_seq1:90-863(+)